MTYEQALEAQKTRRINRAKRNAKAGRTLRCPTCAGGLRVASHSGYSMVRCPTCHGAGMVAPS